MQLYYLLVIVVSDVKVGLSIVAVIFAITRIVNNYNIRTEPHFLNRTESRVLFSKPEPNQNKKSIPTSLVRGQLLSLFKAEISRLSRQVAKEHLFLLLLLLLLYQVIVLLLVANDDHGDMRYLISRAEDMIQVCLLHGNISKIPAFTDPRTVFRFLLVNPTLISPAHH